MARKITLHIAGGYPALGKLEGVFEAPAFGVTETLAVNNDLFIDDDGDVAYRKTWNVTHIPTGWAVLRGLPSRGVAVAAAELLETAGLGGITTADPREASAAFVKRDIAKWKAWIADLTLSTGPAAGISPTQLEEALRKEIRRGARGETIARAAKRTPPREKPQPKPQRTPDLIALARRARGGNPQEVAAAKERCLSW